MERIRQFENVKYNFKVLKLSDQSDLNVSESSLLGRICRFRNPNLSAFPEQLTPSREIFPHAFCRRGVDSFWNNLKLNANRFAALKRFSF